MISSYDLLHLAQAFSNINGQMLPEFSFIPANAIFDAFATGKESSTTIVTGSPWIYIFASNESSVAFPFLTIFLMFCGFSANEYNVDRK